MFPEPFGQLTSVDMGYKTVRVYISTKSGFITLFVILVEAILVVIGALFSLDKTQLKN